MNAKLLITVATLALSGAVIAEDYQSFSVLDYTRVDYESADADAWLLGTRYFLDDRSTLGPLDRFTYINPVSSFGAAYANFDGNDDFLIDGEYFFDKFVVGLAATEEDGIERAWLGYLFSDNLIARLEAVDEFVDTELYLSARYQLRFEGNDYLGFTARIDEDLNDLSLSTEYFRALSSGRYFSIGASIVDTESDSYATLNGRYYWTERTSVSAGLRNSSVRLGFKHFFNSQFSLGVEYAEDDRVDLISVRLGAQF